MVNIPVNEDAFNKWKSIAGKIFVILGLITIATGFFSFGKYVLFVTAFLFVANTILFTVKVKND